MVDAADVEQVEGLPDVGRRALLPGVGNRQEPLGPGPVEDGDEVRGRVAHLGGVEPDGVEHVTVGQRRLERRHRRLGRQVAQEAEDEPRRDPEVPGPVGERVGDAVQHRVERDAALGVGLGVEEHLGVPHPVALGAGQVGAR